jgi:phosphoribosylglycinamide formyltransferase 1
MSARLVVLASGEGTNCQALIDACSADRLDARVVAVVTNNPEAGVIGRAERSGIDTCFVDHRGLEPEARRLADQRLIEAVAGFGPDLVVLAGWMRVLGADVGQAFPILNLHPAKPGEFAGTRAIERAFDAWLAGEIDESGVMVHWVPDAGVDVGPVIVTDVVPFIAGDTLALFTDRVHRVEHRLIVEGTRRALIALDAGRG